MKCIVLLVLFLVTLPASRAADLQTDARAALAQTSGTIKLPGLTASVTVLRDHWGVAHIYARNQHDLFFAQGFVAAQDRLFQMELWKRAGQGRLAEVLGASAVQRDRYARLLRYRGDMKAEYASYAPDAYAILKAFTDGINAFIKSTSKLPIEFRLAGFVPEPWKPEDCLSRMAAFSMTGNAFAELDNTATLNALGSEKFRRLSNPSPMVDPDPVAGVDYSGVTPAWLQGLVGGDARIEFPSEQNPVGSNNWTVSGKLTASGRPILANDPHRVMAVPSLRYLVHLVAPGWDVIGSGEPALPGVAIGHNRSIAWGLTIFPVDQQDLYFEEVNPADPTQYKSGTDGHWEKFRTEDTTISVKGGAPQKTTLRLTAHGPVMAEDATHHRVITLRWVGSEPGTAGYLASLSLDRASNWKEFLAAMARWKLPPENMVYADTHGNIGEQSAGLTPIRSWTGQFPVPGDGRHEWTGYIPFEQLPRSFNPDKGFIATANNNTLPRDFKYKAGYQWATYRVIRVEEALREDIARAGRKLTMEDMQSLQSDLVSIPARDLVAQLSDTDSNEWVNRLRGWNFSIDGGPAAALYEMWERNVRIAIGKKITGETQARAGGARVEVVLDYLRSGADSFESKHQMLLTALTDAAEQMKKLQGADPAKWSWDALHAITFRHSLDQLPGVKALADVGPIPRPGDSNTVNATGSGAGFVQVAGASYREILDLSDWDKSVAVNTPGQSGQPGSPHYADLAPLWAEGKYFPLLYSRAKVEDGSEKLVLVP